MKPAPFEYIAADSLEAASNALNEYGEAAKLLAGGQSLIPSMNFRVVQPQVLIDLNSLHDLRYIRGEPDGGLAIGAMTTQRQMELDPQIAAAVPLLAEALPYIAHPQIRNRGTLGGSLVHADPAAELPVVAVACRARVRLQGGGEARWIEATDFFQGMFMTDLAPEEILVEVVFPHMPPLTGWSFMEISRRRGDYAMMGLAVSLTLDEKAACTDAKLVYLNAGDGPVIATEAAGVLVGTKVERAAREEAATIACEREIDPFGNVHASVDYQRHLARVLTLRALEKALSRVQPVPGGKS